MVGDPTQASLTQIVDAPFRSRFESKGGPLARCCLGPSYGPFFLVLCSVGFDVLRLIFSYRRKVYIVKRVYKNL